MGKSIGSSLVLQLIILCTWNSGYAQLKIFGVHKTKLSRPILKPMVTQFIEFISCLLS